MMMTTHRLVRQTAAIVCATLFFLPAANAQTGLVTVTQQPSQVQWQVDGATFPISSSQLTVTGPEQDGTVPSFCEESPFVCNLESTSGLLELNTTGFTGGQYNWRLEIIPDTSDTSACGSPESIREQQGGQQGLDDTISQSYIDCLRDNNLLPAADQELTELGTFLITDDEELIVPVDPGDGGEGDNLPPVAQCQDVSIELGADSCSVAANVDDGSFDPEGNPVTLEQSPAGPFGPGDHAVTLTVTDDVGLTASCSAVVSVADVTAPVIACNAPDSITPPDAPISFTATAEDACGAHTVNATSFDCYMFTPNGKRVDKTGSCVVSLSGDTVTIEESGGVGTGTFIDWTVEAIDASGNASDTTCTVKVANPGKGKGNGKGNQ